jgi:uncharacterized protein (TIGR02611 family)
MVPLTPGYLVRDLAVDLALPLVIASRPGLGTINHTLLTIEAARAAGLRVAGVVMTPWRAEPEPIERSNRATVERLGAVGSRACRRRTRRRSPRPAVACRWPTGYFERVADHDYLGSRPGPDREDIPDLIRKLRERKIRHKQRHPVHRAGVVVFGFLVVLAGIVMSGPGIPGPGIAVILIGLGLLALEFDRAERLLERAIRWADRAAERAERTSTRQRVAAGVAAAVAVGAFAYAAIRWDIPLVPVL